MPLTYSSHIRKTVAALTLTAATGGLCFAQSRHDHDADDPFLPSPVRTASTVPTNGDLNPYGVAFIKDNFQTGTGQLQHGDVLVSNFNNNQNLQGTGSTIVRFPATGSPSVFFAGASPLGLSTAIGTLQYGFIVVGSLPTLDGTFATAQAGSLLVINSQGQLIQTITSPEINGPWDMALVDRGDRAIAFIANAISGTISRLDFAVNPKGLSLLSSKTIASGYKHQGDPAALFDAPTGLVYDHRRDVLYVASTLDNAIFAVRDAADRHHDAGTGEIIYQDNVNLHGALAMAMAPNGHLLVSNNDVINADPNQSSEIVEFTTNGQFVKELSVDPNLGGFFGLAVNATGNTATFAAVDDNTASLLIWTLNLN
jgi:hypothetical protein